ncbi:MAG: hypothetical protein ACLFM0_06905 [Spirochaetales bacterium]
MLSRRDRGTEPGRSPLVRFVVSTLLLALALAPATAGAQTVIATTPWTAAFAELAGAEDVELLAPYEMRHPPEYEIRADDLRRVQDADLLVYAGYETMMDQLQDAIGDSSVDSVQISTTYTEATLESETMKIASALGSEDIARERVAEVVDFLEQWRDEIQEHELDENPVIAHYHQESLFEDLGVNVVDTFGPGPLEARQIASMSEKEPDLVVDNWHTEQAQPFAETLPDVPRVALINFPGENNTRTILDVLRYNREKLNEALRE